MADTPSPEPDPQLRTMRILGALAGAGILLAIIIGIAFPTIEGQGVALLVGGIACVLGVSVAFYAVGRSEDRDRDQRTPDS